MHVVSSHISLRIVLDGISKAGKYCDITGAVKFYFNASRMFLLLAFPRIQTFSFEIAETSMI